MRTLFLAALIGLAACGDDFASVQRADTIEAYEAYLKANPKGRWQDQATLRLEELYITKAEEDASLESFDAYMKRFPEGFYKSKALDGRESFLFEWARSTNTITGWKKYLDEYKSGHKKHRKAARRMLEVARYGDKLALSEPRIAKVNMAEQKDGPLDGWGFTVDVTNNSDQTFKTLALTIWYLDAEGRRLDEREWPVVTDFWPIPMEEEKKLPMKPGETRSWFWSTDRLPEHWSQQVKVFPSKIIVAK